MVEGNDSKEKGVNGYRRSLLQGRVGLERTQSGYPVFGRNLLSVWSALTQLILTTDLNARIEGSLQE